MSLLVSACVTSTHLTSPHYYGSAGSPTLGGTAGLPGQVVGNPSVWVNELLLTPPDTPPTSADMLPSPQALRNPPQGNDALFLAGNNNNYNSQHVLINGIATYLPMVTQSKQVGVRGGGAKYADSGSTGFNYLQQQTSGLGGVLGSVMTVPPSRQQIVTRGDVNKPAVLIRRESSLDMIKVYSFVEELLSPSTGANVVAIDNKIEQAMDLVKTHLMYAVREEVEVLKERIEEQNKKMFRLEWENQILREHATPEVLARLNAATSPIGAGSTGAGQTALVGGAAPLSIAGGLPPGAPVAAMTVPGTPLSVSSPTHVGGGVAAGGSTNLIGVEGTSATHVPAGGVGATPANSNIAAQQGSVGGMGATNFQYTGPPGATNGMRMGGVEGGGVPPGVAGGSQQPPA